MCVCVCVPFSGYKNSINWLLLFVEISFSILVASSQNTSINRAFQCFRMIDSVYWYRYLTREKKWCVSHDDFCVGSSRIKSHSNYLFEDLSFEEEKMTQYLFCFLRDCNSSLLDLFDDWVIFFSGWRLNVFRL